MKQIILNIKALAGAIKTNGAEIALYLFIAIGLPVVAWLYVNTKLAATVFILVHIPMLYLSLRYGKRD